MLDSYISNSAPDVYRIKKDLSNQIQFINYRVLITMRSYINMKMREYLLVIYPLFSIKILKNDYYGR